MFERDHGRRLDVRAHALEFAGAIRPRPAVIHLDRLVRPGVGRTILKAAGLDPGNRDPMEDDLVASGRFVRIETRGEQTGLRRTVTVGFVEDAQPPPGALLVAAGSADAAWAGNLIAEPSCRATVGGRSFEAVAAPLGPTEHARAIRELILRYGTPAEGLGRGPSFRIRPAGEGEG